MVRTIQLILLAAAMTVIAGACQTPPSAPPPVAQESAQETAAPAMPPAAPATGSSQPPETSRPATVRRAIERSLPESLLAAPVKDLAQRAIDYGTMLSSRSANATLKTGWQYRRTRQDQIVGFEFSNHGGNPILPPRRDATRNQFFTRDFQFRFDDRARQDIHLMISDWAPSRDRVFRLSELVNSLLHFFPRSYLPAIVNAGDRNIVTLPTGEEVEFDAASKEIRAGVLTEAPVDLNSAPSGRSFPAVNYLGQGVVVRADSRGADPRLGAKALITSGAPAPLCEQAGGCRQCEVPAKELWEQSGAVRFKFPTDQEFDRYLTARCAFGLPRQGNDFAVATPPAR